MPKIELSKLAQQDLIDIWLYSLEEWGITQADMYLDQIDNALNTLTHNPEIGINSNHIRENYRKFKINRHFIWYKIVRQKTIYVVRILGEEMDYKSHL
tara:strand:+ start:377 stop:670 length:294 start_codon:yes stop_codon:yes gene_type:complete